MWVIGFPIDLLTLHVSPNVRPINTSRSTLAAETLNALQLFLREPLLHSSLTELQKMLRGSITPQQVFRLIDLGPILEEIVVKSRDRLAGEEHPTTMESDVSSAFSQAGKKLW